MNSDLKAQLRELNITAAKEIDVGSSRKAIIIFVPVPQLKSFQKIQVRLVRELEKKFSGKHVVFIGTEEDPSQAHQEKAASRISRSVPGVKMSSATQRLTGVCPYSRTLTSVHDAILEDLVYPSEIVARGSALKLDSSRLIKVETFSGVYKKLTGKDVVFEFPEFQL
ncbi:hypothetical protein CRUP_022388 [Coryphaenoides rupestris]|nr:hypothetical protein CRUP_022388 [Coryphaenoides rupestris]